MRYRAKGCRGGDDVVELEVDALSASDAMDKVQQLGYFPLAVASVADSGRARHFDVSLFCQELLGLLGAGLTLVEALETLAEKTRQSATRAILNDVLNGVREGARLAAVMERFPTAFPPLLVAAVRASETTGTVTEAIRQYYDYRIRMESVGKRIISAVIYPAVLFGVGLVVVLFLLGYVIPRFSLVFDELDAELPFASQLLIAWGNAVNSHPGAVVTITIALFAVMGVIGVSPKLRGRLVERVWAISWLGEKLRIYYLTRLYRTLGMLLHGGIPLVRALEMVRGLVPSVMSEHLECARHDIAGGLAMSVAFDRHGLASEVAQRLIRIGEKSGELGGMLTRTADLHDDELAHFTERFAKVFEPALMAIIGVVIGGVVLLMYLPIFSLVEAVQ